MEQFGLFDNPTDWPDKLFRWREGRPDELVRDVQAGQILCHQGSAAEYLFELVSGTIRLSTVTEDGRNIVLGFPSSGAIVGLTGASEYTYSAKTITAVKLRSIGRVRFYREVMQNKQARERLIRWIATQEADAQQHISMLAMAHPSSRIAAFLIKMADRQNADVGGRPVTIDLPMTQRDIAAHLAIAPETYSRIIRKLREAGLVQAKRLGKDNNSIEIYDIEQLNDIAGGQKI
ncbi:Crp/Fnr family transcriptional regulator [Parasphingorhabdus sp.]|uniref:Crp/Fnr family transcriptional regulator n=1 Tax=Parasphingorhabdus sp. TaxID=2709688 RepID=UPI003A90315D